MAAARDRRGRGPARPRDLPPRRGVREAPRQAEAERLSGARGGTTKVTFEKTPIRRYVVRIERETAPPLWTYGPGYDDELPHDLLHFVAEAELGLDGGVFGDIAAGGNARMFLPFDRGQIPRLWRRKRAHGYRLPDGGRSERISWLLEEAWAAHHEGRPRDPLWADRRAAVGLEESAAERLLPLLDELAGRWRALGPGEGLTLDWPRPEGRRRHPRRQRRRPPRARR